MFFIGKNLSFALSFLRRKNLYLSDIIWEFIFAILKKDSIICQNYYFIFKTHKKERNISLFDEENIQKTRKYIYLLTDTMFNFIPW